MRRRQIEVVWNGESHAYTLDENESRTPEEIVDDFLHNVDVFVPED